MEVCYPVMDMATVAVPSTILPDYFFLAQQQQHVATTEVIRGNCKNGRTEASKPGKKTAAAVSFSHPTAAAADAIPSAHHPGPLYGSFRQEHAYSNPQRRQTTDGSVAQAYMAAAAAGSLPTAGLSREQQQVAMLHQLHQRHLQAAAAQQLAAHQTAQLAYKHQQQHARTAVSDPTPASLAPPAAQARITAPYQHHQHQEQVPYSEGKLTAAGSYQHIGSNINNNKVGPASHAQCLAAVAAAAGSRDDVLVLCDETADQYSSGCCSPFSDNSYCSRSMSMDMDSTDDLENRDQQRPQDTSECQVSTSKAAAAAALQAAAVLQVLGKVADQRKGWATLHPAGSSSRRNPAGTPAADAAGSKSVRARLLVTEVSVYHSDMEGHRCWANSPIALAHANKLMSSMELPDSVVYMPTMSDSWIFQIAAGYQFPSFAVCLGSSYLQRMMATLPQLAEAAAAVPEFECYCDYLPTEVQPAQRNQPLTGHELAATKATLRSIQFTCLFLALKVADRVHALGLLRYILTKISHNQRLVSFDDVADVEGQCLNALGWRLGPWFGDADLSGNDEELWVAGMGGLEYGTDMDCWE